jgi:hypothetical protein
MLFAIVATLCASFAFGLMVAVLPDLAERFIGDAKAGSMLAVALIAVPVFPTLGQSEAIYTALGLAGFTLLVERKARTWWLGLICGLLVLLSPSVIPFVAVYLLGAFMRRLLTLRQIGAVSFLSFGLCLPWMLRNEIRLGAFAIRDNLGLELQVNNNSFASPDTSGIFASNSRYHPNMSVQQAEVVKAIGEARFNAAKRAQAIDWIETHPVAFASLSIRRLMYYWFPGRYHMPFSIAVWLLTLASLPSSLYILLKRRGSAPYYLLLSMIAFSLPYYVFLGDLRYRMPILWITALFACQTVMQLRQRMAAALLT